MLIELSPVTYEFNNCFQGLIESIVEQCYKRNYLYTQLGRWENNLSIENNEIVNYQPFAFLEVDELELIGLKLDKVECANIDETINNVKEELEHGIPVIVGVQIANIPWDPNYQKDFKMEHFVAIHGYDEEKDTFLCCDTIYNKSAVELPMKEFVSGGSLVYRKVVETKQASEYKLGTLEELLYDHAKKMLEQEDSDFSRFRKMGQFFHENAGKITIDQEHVDSVLFSTGYMDIRDYTKARELLCHLLKEHKEGENLAALFQISMENWIHLRILYVRACTSKRKEKCFHKVGDAFDQIADLEEGIARYIVDGDVSHVEAYLPEKDDTEQAADNQDTNERKIKQVSLDAYYNNKAFGTMSNEENAEFSVSGEYLLCSADKAELTLDDGSTLPILENSRYDNVVCSGQCIEQALEQVSTLCVIGTTEYVGEHINLTVHFDDGEVQEFPLNFPEWYTEIMQQEILVGMFNAIQKEPCGKKETSFTGKIFMKKFKLKKSTVKKIELPSDGRIHIFHIWAF